MNIQSINKNQTLIASLDSIQIMWKKFIGNEMKDPIPRHDEEI